MAIKLNLEERYRISMYSRRLPCTLELRFAMEKFLADIEITPEEAKKYEVKLDNGDFLCNSLDYKTEYEEFPEPVVIAMKSYIKMLDHEKNKGNEMLQRTFKYFRKVCE